MTDNYEAGLDQICTLMSNGLLKDAYSKLQELAALPGYRPSRLFMAKYCELLDQLGLDDEFHSLCNQFKDIYPNVHNPYTLTYQYYLKRGHTLKALQEIASSPETIAHVPTKTAVLYAETRLAIYHSHSYIKRPFSDPSKNQVCNKIVDTMAICMLVRDEADIIYANLLHHYTLGCRKFAIMDNLSVDGTPDVVRRFASDYPDANVALLLDFFEGYYQGIKTRALCRYAQTYFECTGDPINWLFPLDADEFVDFPSEMGFSHLLDEIKQRNAKIVVFHLCNSANSAGKPYSVADDIYGVIDVAEACSGNIVTKNGFDPLFIDGLTDGNHTLKHSSISRSMLFKACDLGVRIVHFKFRSPEHVKSKILNGGKALQATTLAQNVGAHWRTAYVDMQNRGPCVADEIFVRYCNETASLSNTLKMPSYRI
jgi:hypothetical protein